MTTSLNPFRQAQYLSAMGIQRWVLRNHPSLTHLATLSIPMPESPPPTTSVNLTMEVIQTEKLPVIPVIEPTSLTPIIDELPTSSLDWKQLQSRVASCTQCELYKQRKQTIFGAGPQQAQWMFIGEAPGEEEDIQGLPFVGAAGPLLDAMLYAIGLTREEVYMTNIVKCRPPKDRDLKLEEMVHCNAFLHRQIVLLKPKLIVALGAVAAQHLLNSSEKIGELRGQRFEYEGIPLIATYHPAYLLRRPIEKRKSWHDLQFIYRTFTEACSSQTTSNQTEEEFTQESKA